MRRAALLAPLVLAASAVSCTGTTGYQLVSFYAAAVGPADATPGNYAFTLGRWQITLTKAVIHIGAMYLDQSLPTSGAGPTACVLNGTYVGEVRGGQDFDMLSPTPQPFPVAGDGSTLPAAVGQVWLTGSDVFADSDPTVVLSVRGTAVSMTDGKSYDFGGDITIDKSRAPAQVGSALPGSNPMCLQRIVTPILTDITLGQSGTLLLHLDPKALFINVDFSALPSFTAGPKYGFTNDQSNQPSINLYANLRAAGPVYRFEWVNATE